LEGLTLVSLMKT